MKTDCAHYSNRSLTAYALLVACAASFFPACGGRSVSQPSGPGPLTITTVSLPDGFTLSLYSQPLNAVGGKRPYTWKISSGQLPTGLVFYTQGALVGTPTATGSFDFTLQVTDAASSSVGRPMNLKVIEGLVITSPFEALLWLKEPYSQTLTATGGTKPYTWTTTRVLPLGITLSSDGVLSGTPTQSGHDVFDVYVHDAGPPGQTASHWFDTFVYRRLAIATSRLPAGRPNAPYLVTIDVAGNSAESAYARSITSGSLPSGLNLNASTGEVLGIPTEEGTFDFTLEVTETAKVVQTVSRALSLTIASNLGRNDSPATATPISNGTIRASISPFADPVAGPANPDHDFYELSANPGSVVTVETKAKRLSRESPIDTVLEIVNAEGNRFSTCRAQWDQSFNQFCLNDDIELENTQDSRLQFQVPDSETGPVTFFVHVFSWDGNARPDYVYDLTVSGAN